MDASEEANIMSAHVERFGFSDIGCCVADRNLPGMHEQRERSRQTARR
jgi:hypothetical protein